MTRSPRRLVWCLALALAGLSGCAVHGVYWVDPTPTATVVYAAPPPVRVAVRPPAPYVGAVWVGGYWHWDGGSWVWIDGQWVNGRPGHVYVRPSWVHRGRGWVYVEGGWRARGHAHHGHPGRGRGRRR